MRRLVFLWTLVCFPACTPPPQPKTLPQMVDGPCTYVQPEGQPQVCASASDVFTAILTFVRREIPEPLLDGRDNEQFARQIMTEEVQKIRSAKDDHKKP